MCNQALLKAIHIDEDNDVRVGYGCPYDGLADTDLQADALTWAAQDENRAKKEPRPRVVPWSRSSHLTHLGCSALRAYDPCVVGSHEHAR